MARNSQRGSKNNNPEGRNQYSSYGVRDMARERPLTTAVTAAAAVGAGVFLWSRRNEISEQLSNLSEQIGDWRDNMSSGRNEEFEMADSQIDSSSTPGVSASGTTTANKGGARGGRQTGMSETGGGNASLGAHSGGGNTMAGNSGRARA